MDSAQSSLNNLVNNNHSKPIQVVGVINAYCALLAKQAGFKAIYLSGAGVANAQYGMPDLGMTSQTEVAEEIRRITAACDLPLLVDADTGFGDILNVGRTVRQFESAGASGMHLEDQIFAKRCGHRDNKKLISTNDMVAKIKSAVDNKKNSNFTVMARTDAIASEGLEQAINRMQNYVDAGADMIFAEAITKLDDYQEVTNNISVPVLANITEFGKTPLFTLNELKSVNIKLVLYPLSAFRAMSKAALDVYHSIYSDETQQNCLDKMQTREELYSVLGYKQIEKNLDKYLEQNN